MIEKPILIGNIDPEDFRDSLLKLEKSFGIKFANNSMKNAKTLGDIPVCGSEYTKYQLVSKR